MSSNDEEMIEKLVQESEEEKARAEEIKKWNEEFQQWLKSLPLIGLVDLIMNCGALLGRTIDGTDMKQKEWKDE